MGAATLQELGLRPRDVFTVLHAAGASHFVLAKARRPAGFSHSTISSTTM